MQIYSHLMQSVKVLREKRALRDLSKIGKLGNNVHVTPTFRCRYFGSVSKPIQIGNNTSLAGEFYLEGKGQISVGNYCSFRERTFIGALYSVEIGNHVFGAADVYICDNNNHPISPKARLEMTLQPPGTSSWKWEHKNVEGAPIRIEDCVWLGRYCMILKGVTIGRGSIVAAGAVVTKSIPPFSIAAGNPARVVKTLENDLD